jgi:serine/threonine-protein kinase RsbW
MSGRSHDCSPLEYAYVASKAQTWRYHVLSTAAEMGLFLNEVIGSLEHIGYPRQDVFAVRLALEEAIVNAIKHGNRGDSSKQVQVRYCAAPDCFLAEVEDEGEGFSYAAVAARAERNGRPAGHGLAMMLRYMTWVEHNEPGNCVTLCKYRSQE